METFRPSALMREPALLVMTVGNIFKDHFSTSSPPLGCATQCFTVPSLWAQPAVLACSIAQNAAMMACCCIYPIAIIHAILTFWRPEVKFNASPRANPTIPLHQGGWTISQVHSTLIDRILLTNTLPSPAKLTNSYDKAWPTQYLR